MDGKPVTRSQSRLKPIGIKFVLLKSAFTRFQATRPFQLLEASNLMAQIKMGHVTRIIIQLPSKIRVIFEL